MLVKKDHLGLSLGLSSSDASCHVQLDLMPPVDSPPGSGHTVNSERRMEAVQRPMWKSKIDVNKAPIDEWEAAIEAGSSSPNSAGSSASAGGRRGLGVARVFFAGIEVGEAEQESSRGVSDEEDGEGARKKLRLSKDQSAILEESFKDHNTLNPKQKMALAKQLNLRPRQVEVWFQNRRARTKLKQTEVDCEFLKRCCDNLTEENRRLQKEVQELRALKLSPQFYMHMTPPTTLTICPACDRVSPPPPPPQTMTHPASTGENRLFVPALCASAGQRSPWAPIPLRPSFLDTPPQRH